MAQDSPVRGAARTGETSTSRLVRWVRALSHRARLGMILACASLIFFSVPSLAQQKTTVSDTLVAPGGSPVVGGLTITSAQTFTSSDGFVVPIGQITSATISATGLFTVQLIPNSGATPTGTWYKVSYKTSTNNFTETWQIPQSATPVNLLTVRALNPPSPPVVIPFPQNIPDPSCTAILAADPTAQPVPIWNGVQWKCGRPNTGSVTMDLENPTAADTGRFEWKPKNSITLTRLSCSVDVGTVIINLDVRQESSPNSSGTQVLSTPLTCTPTTGATTSITSPNVPGLSPVALLVVGSSGAGILRVHAEYQLSP